MKLFRFYRRPVVVPSRSVEDYSPDEQLRLQKGFQAVAERYRRHMCVFYCGIIGFAVCGACGSHPSGTSYRLAYVLLAYGHWGNVDGTRPGTSWA